MAKKDLIAELKEFGITPDASLKVEDLEALLSKVKGQVPVQPEVVAAPAPVAPVEERITAPAPAPVEEATPLEAFEGKSPLVGKALIMKAKLAAEPKVRFFIPLGDEEKQGTTQSVILNGYPMFIQKGTPVSIPESVADVLEAKMNQRMRVLNHPNRLGGDGTMKLDTFGSN